MRLFKRSSETIKRGVVQPFPHRRVLASRRVFAITVGLVLSIPSGDAALIRPLPHGPGRFHRLQRFRDKVPVEPGPAASFGRQMDRKRGSDALLTLHGKIVPQELTEGSRDRQPESRSAESPPGGPVGLQERLEYGLKAVGGDAYARVPPYDGSYL